jgi:glycosyltransferase involved in cell wall biosynthesis
LIAFPRGRSKRLMNIGTDLTNLRVATTISGIQRVVLEANHHLDEIFTSQGLNFYGFATKNFNKLVKQSNLTDESWDKRIKDWKELDCLFFLDLNMTFPALDLIREKSHRKLRVISMVHDIMPITNPDWFPLKAVTTLKEESSILSKTLFRFYLQGLSNVSDIIVVPSLHVKNEILSLGMRNLSDIRVIPLGSKEPQNFERKKNKTSVKQITYVSTIEPRKGHIDLINAMSIIWENNLSDLNLTLVGRYGWDSEILIEKITNHKEFGKKLIWENNCGEDKLEQIYSNSDLVVVPSIGEGFGFSIEEALARDIPVLARDLVVFKERSNPNLSFYEGGPEQLADTIVKKIKIPWKSNSQKIRSMRDFAKDLSMLIS